MLGVAACRVSFSTTHRLIFVEGSALEGSAGRYDCKKKTGQLCPVSQRRLGCGYIAPGAAGVQRLRPWLIPPIPRQPKSRSEGARMQIVSGSSK